MNETKGKWGYLIASAIVSSAVGYFAPKILDALIPWLSENPLSQYPMETVGIAVAASLIGFFAGSKFGKSRSQKQLTNKDTEIADLKKRPTQETLDAKVSEKDNQIAEFTEALEAEKTEEPPALTGFDFLLWQPIDALCTAAEQLGQLDDFSSRDIVVAFSYQGAVVP